MVDCKGNSTSQALLPAHLLRLSNHESSHEAIEGRDVECPGGYEDEQRYNEIHKSMVLTPFRFLYNFVHVTELFVHVTELFDPRPCI